MITRYDIITEAAATVGGRGLRENDLERLGRWLNKILVSLSERHSFHLLRRRTTISLADASTTSGQEGSWLPANLAGIDAVQDSSTGKYYYRRELDSIDNIESRMPRYSVYAPSLSPLFWSDDCYIDRGDTSFTSTELDTDGSDHTGEWVRFGNEPQFYQLSASKTISETYWGPSQAGADIEIRPKTQKKLMVHTDHDTQLTSGSVIVHYWIYHPLMYRDSDLLLLPYPRLVDLMMQKEAKGSLSRRSRDPLNAEIDEAWKETVRLNPSFYVPADPLDRIGNHFDPNQITFTRRGAYTKNDPLNVEDWRD